MENGRTNEGQSLGIAALVLGILCFFMAFVPCIGVIAIIPGVIAIILSIIGLIQANKNNGAKGLNIAALIVSILGTLISCFWVFFMFGVSTFGEDQFEYLFENMIQEVTYEMDVYNEEIDEDLYQLEYVDSINVEETIIIDAPNSGEIKVDIEEEWFR